MVSFVYDNFMVYGSLVNDLFVELTSLCSLDDAMKFRICCLIALIFWLQQPLNAFLGCSL